MCIFSDPSDPISPKDNPTRVPYSPKHSDGKESYNPNDVLVKPGEITICSLNLGKLVIEWRIYGNNLAFGRPIVRPAKTR